MLQTKMRSAMPVSESTSMNVVVSNLALPSSNARPTYSVCSYTAPGESMSRCAPLSESAVRLGNSLLAALVPEQAIRRDGDEGF
jgi:hypothetical protein